MLRVAQIGIGSMGRGHLDQYIRLEQEGFDVKLVAICDIDPLKFKGIFRNGNIDNVGVGKYQFEKYHLYTDIDELLAQEQLDYVDIALPTYLHAEAAIKAMQAGVNVLCEKPMALNPAQCQHMIDVQQQTGKRLMIAQCLRFWPAYETLKHYVDSGELGPVHSAYFFRGGATPKWSYQNWLIDEQRSGGCLLDQHVHDVDMVHYLFGVPKRVSTHAARLLEGAGFDTMSTHYDYGNFVVNTQDDWTMNGSPFVMLYRVNFKGGTVVWENGKTMVYPVDGEPFEADDKNGDNGYYREVKYFANSLLNNTPIETSTPESTMETIVIATAEHKSASNDGAWIKL